MKNLHRRVIEFTFFSGDLPMFETDQQAQEWYAALGRLVTYALHGQNEGGGAHIGVLVLGNLQHIVEATDHHGA